MDKSVLTVTDSRYVYIYLVPIAHSETKILFEPINGSIVLFQFFGWLHTVKLNRNKTLKQP